MKIPIARPNISEDEKQAVLEVLSSGVLTKGDNVENFEKQFARYTGTKHAITVNSGTAALHMSVMALGLKDGDEVITTPFSFASSANCLLYAGAKPVFVDIDPRSYNIDTDKIEEKITDKTKAILPVHLYGQPANMEKLVKLAKTYDLKIIEDACQAHGAKYNGQKAGSFGNVAAFSFYPTKNMTTGEGGMVTTNDDILADWLRTFRNIGQPQTYRHTMLGFNYRMQEMSAAIGLLQLRKLEENNKKRIENATFFMHRLSDLDGLLLPWVDPKANHVFHQFTVRVTSDKVGRDDLAKKLAEEGIETRIYYPLPIHKQPLYQSLGYDASLPESENACKEVLSIPVYPALSKEELEFISEKLNSIFN